MNTTKKLSYGEVVEGCKFVCLIIRPIPPMNREFSQELYTELSEAMEPVFGRFPSAG